ncbi:MAG TPA: DnaB-like helicase N-terminal domain-containing protein, partial [Rhodothermales bacterium]|nr:DnaB-like helicase N-terminal domain-containing protein [Rhodothermales bacterium]
MEQSYIPEQSWVSLPHLQQDLSASTGQPARETKSFPKEPALQDGRVPPQSPEVEQSVLGAMLIEPEAIPEAIELLQEKSFYDPRHRFIFKAIAGLFERNIPVDLITLTEELRRLGHLEVVGGAYYVSELSMRVASAANVGYHARIVAEKSLLRQMIETMTGVIQKAY